MRSRNHAPKNAVRFCCDTVHIVRRYDKQSLRFYQHRLRTKNIQLCRTISISHFNKKFKYYKRIYIFGTEACACPHTIRRRRKKEKQGKTLLNHAEGVDGIARRASGWNPQLVAAWNLAKGEYGIHRRWEGIKTEGEGRYTASRDAMRGRAAMPYNAKGVDSIPSPSVLDK